MTKLYASLFAMLVLMLATSQCAHAADLVTTPYFSMDEAAKAALIDAYNCGEQVRECGGAIYVRAKDAALPYTLYFYSQPEKGRPFGVTIHALTDPAPTRMKLVGDYHSHICSVHNRMFTSLFSFADLLTNQGFHTVGYMLDGCSGNVHRYDPAQDTADDVVIHFTSGRVLELTEGHITGWINVYARVQ